MFPEPFKVKIDKEKQKVTFSVRVTDGTVVLHRVDLAQFRKMVFEFQAADQE